MMLALLTVPSMLPLTTSKMQPALVHRGMSRAAINMAMPLVAEYSNVHDHMASNEVDMRALRDRMVAQMSVDAANVVHEMELIDLRKKLSATQTSVDELTSQNVVLAREKDVLTTQLRHSSPGYVGMPFGHSLANCLAHGRDAAIAARSDALWQMRRCVERSLDVRRAVAFGLQIFALRAGLRLKRKLDEVQRSWAQQKQNARADVAHAAKVCARAWVATWAWTGLCGQMAKEAADISSDMMAARKVVMARA